MSSDHVWKRYDSPCDEWWEISAHVFFSCTFHPPQPLYTPRPLLCRRCIKEQRDTGNTSSRNVLSHLLSHWRLLLFAHREISLLIKKRVQSSKQSCSCHQIRWNCKFSSWQFWTSSRSSSVEGHLDGDIKRVLYLFTSILPKNSDYVLKVKGCNVVFPQSNSKSYCSSGGQLWWEHLCWKHSAGAHSCPVSQTSVRSIALTLPQATKIPNMSTNVF